MGVQPDGDNCTFSYKILGYLNIDDLVGITEMGYSNYTEFCEDGGVEFKASNTGSGFDVEESIDFWLNPGDEDANSNRTSIMVEMYNELASNGTSANMSPLPSIETLTSANPKCEENSPKCASAANGCARSLYSQICMACSSSDSCEAPSSSFPDLKLPSNASSSSSEDGSSDSSNDVGDSSTDSTTGSANALSDDSGSKTSSSSSAASTTKASAVAAFAALVVSSLL
ncbi:hypothetical protein PI125_g8669 [Phytophthora idaei]|nr:hypothetical protein PI125_g8669 [Phytophthora idaei]